MEKILRIISLFIFILLVIFNSSSYSEEFIPATDTTIYYTGRIRPESGIVHLTWPGSSLEGRFTGNSLKLILSETTRNSIWVKIGQGNWQAFNHPGQATAINLVTGQLPVGVYDYRIVKKTESDFGPLSVSGLIVNDREVILPPKYIPKKKIELIGDSITAGFAVYGKANAENNDALNTYGYLAARELNLEPMITAVSGIGISHNYGNPKEEETMPQRYKRLVLNTDSVWMDFSTWHPDIITINLGTNDRTVSCDTELFERRWDEFLTELRRLHPVAWILVLRSFHGYFEKNLEKIVLQRKKEGDRKIEFIDTTGWLTGPGDYTDGTHPNIRGHRKAADRLIPVLKKYLKK